MRINRGEEFFSNQFTSYCQAHGIHRQLTASYTPEQNEVAERKNRTIVKMTRSMLQAKALPNFYWVEGVAIAIYLLNRSPTKTVLNQTPYEAWSGKKPQVSHLKVFGSVAYARISPDDRHKLDKKSVKCIFVGYSNETKGYRLFDPVAKKLIISRDVVFDEHSCYELNKVEQNSPKFIEVEMEPEIEKLPTMTTSGSPSTSNSRSSPREMQQLENIYRTSSQKVRSLREIYESCDFALALLEPSCFEEANQKEEWRTAMNEEMTAIEKNQT